MTPQHIVLAARLLAPPVLGALALAICSPSCPAAGIGAVTFATALVLLQAAPRIRAADILAGLALFVTLLEWVSASLRGSIDMPGWLTGVGVASAIILLLKVQHMRSLARNDAYVPLRHLERRNALLGRTLAPRDRQTMPNPAEPSQGH